MMNRLSGLAEKTRAALRKRWVRVALVVLVLVAGYGTSWWAAHHVSDTVVITVTHYTYPPLPGAEGIPLAHGQAVTHTSFTVTIHDVTTARALQFVVNHTATLRPPSSPGSVSLAYSYDFQFSFLGVPVQDVEITNFMHISTLGVMSPMVHRRPDSSMWREIEHLSGMPDFGHVSQGAAD